MASPAKPDDRLPSASYSFEPEFTGPPPRALADRLGEGPYARDQRTRAVALIIAGALCLLLSRTPGVDVLALYVLPLGYLFWIGLFLLVAGVVPYVRLALHRGPFLYVRDGLPLAVRVLEVVKAPTAIMNGQPGKAVEVGTPFLGHGLRAWILRVVVVAGSLLLGGLTAVGWCFMANAWLDRSPPRPVPATIVGMTMTTHTFLFREYELEYRLEGSAEKKKLLTTPQHLDGLRDGQAVAHVRDGRLGWPWVEMVTTP